VSKKVVLYSAPTCPWCLKAKQYLEQNNIDFSEHNVAEEPDKYKEMVEASGQTGVPVLAIGDEVIVGFNQPKIEELLQS